MVLELAVVAIWSYLLLGRGGFWRMHEDPARGDNPLAKWPSVTAVVPARDEAATVSRSVGSLASQDYGGEFRIVLVDDGSGDGTADLARSAAPPSVLTVLTGAPLPLGWTGKLWAVSQGVEHASSSDYFLLTDADIVHSPRSAG